MQMARSLCPTFNACVTRHLALITRDGWFNHTPTSRKAG